MATHTLFIADGVDPRLTEALRRRGRREILPAIYGERDAQLVTQGG